MEERRKSRRMELESHFGLYTLFSRFSSPIYTAFLIFALVYAHLAGIKACPDCAICFRPEFCTCAVIIISTLEAATFVQMMKFWNNKENVVADAVGTWGADKCNKGYDIFDYDGTGLLEIEEIGDTGAFNGDDSEAVKAAEKDGVKIIPVDQLPINMPENMRFYGWIDTQDNRERIKEYCDRR
mgnify:CR=1 FL=1